MKKLLTVLLTALALTGCSVVGPGERGIRIHLGSVDNGVLDSGVYLWIPFLYGTKTINIQIQKSDVKTSAASKDMQEITTEIAVNWSLNPDRVVEMYKTIGDEDDIYLRIIAPAVSEVLKSATSKRTAEEVLTHRLDLKKDVDEGLRTRLGAYGINLNDVSFVNLTFSHDFSAAIERKQIAEQKAKEADYVALQAIAESKAVVNKAKGDAESTLVNAKAQAEAQRLLQATISDKVLQLKAIEKWSGDFPQVMGGGSNLLFNIPTKNKQTQGEQ